MNLRGWSYIAQLLLSVEALVLLALALIIAYFLVRGMNAMLKALPPYLRQAHQILEQVHGWVELACRILISPITAVESFLAKARGMRQGLRRWLAGGLFS
ncbi:MAG: hypothetical protein ACP5TV_13830 [Anaerolineae bacterium]